MIKTIIIDDEPLAREGIALLADQINDIEIVETFSSALAASSYIANEHPDLIFMDIEMPGLDGLSFMRSLRRKQQVILTTAYPQYAVEAYELDVIDYLVKPVKEERFLKAVNRARSVINYMKKSREAESTEINKDEIYIKSDRKFVKLNLKDITYIKGLKDYVMVYTVEKKYITAMNVKTIMSHLPSETFARVSKSYIINSHRIKSIENDVINIENEHIPIGNIYKEKFYNSFVKNKTLKR